jgi:hypothetical protein
MNVEHESNGAVWRLEAGAALHLHIGPGSRRLEVTEGRLWITTDADRPHHSLDVWIGAGEAVELPGGLSLVVDAHPRARFRLLVPPQACPPDPLSVRGLLNRCRARWTRLVRASGQRAAAPGVNPALLVR